MKALKVIISIILSILFSICLVGFILLSTTNKILIKETTGGSKGSGNIITSLDKDLFGIDVTKYKKYENVDTVTPDMVHEVVDGSLIKKGYNVKVVDYILKEDDYQSMYTEYKKEIFGYLKGEIEKPNFPKDRLNGMIDRGLTKYNEENKNDKINVEKAKLEFTGEVDVLLDEITSKVDKIKAVPGVSTLLNVVTNKPLKYGLLIGSIICAIILLAINKIWGGFIWIGISSIFSGISLFCSKAITSASILNKIKEYLGNSIKTFENEMTSKGITLIIIGIILIIIGILLRVFVFKNKKDTKEVKKEEVKEEE